MNRELIPRLADRYRVIAPDLPGFGFTVVPEERHYKYSFGALAHTMLAFTDVLGLKHYALYVLTTVLQAGFRLAIARPERVTAIISQNGNAYEDGFGGAWAPIQRYWRQPTIENREALRKELSPEGIRFQYTFGVCALPPSSRMSWMDASYGPRGMTETWKTFSKSRTKLLDLSRSV